MTGFQGFLGREYLEVVYSPLLLGATLRKCSLPKATQLSCWLIRCPIVLEHSLGGLQCNYARNTLPTSKLDTHLLTLKGWKAESILSQLCGLNSDLEQRLDYSTVV